MGDARRAAGRSERSASSGRIAAVPRSGRRVRSWRVVPGLDKDLSGSVNHDLGDIGLSKQSADGSIAQEFVQRGVDGFLSLVKIDRVAVVMRPFIGELPKVKSQLRFAQPFGHFRSYGLQKPFIQRLFRLRAVLEQGERMGRYDVVCPAHQRLSGILKVNR